MSSNELFGGPKRLLTVVAVIVTVALLAAVATLIVRHILGPPEGPSPYETTSTSTSTPSTSTPSTTTTTMTASQHSAP